MPHLKDSQRRHDIHAGWSYPKDGAELNYALTIVVDEYMNGKTLNYELITEIRGALYGALQEFERIIAGPYEATKADENGNAYSAGNREKTWAPGGKPLTQVEYQIDPGAQYEARDVNVSDATGYVRFASINPLAGESAWTARNAVGEAINEGFASGKLTGSRLLNTIASLPSRMGNALSALARARTTSQ